MYKILLSFAILSSFVFAEVTPERIEKDIKLFQENCLDAEGNQIPNGYIDENFTSCYDQAKFLRNEIVLYEDNYLAQETHGRSPCSEVASPDPIIGLSADINEAIKGVKCSNQEKLDSEKSCGKAWNCNMYRSMLMVTDEFPDFIADSFQSFAKSGVKKNNYGPDCLNSDRSNCVEELVTSLAGSFWTTLSSVWDLAKAGATNLWGTITGWIDSKSDSMHASAVQNAESVEGFLDNPGKWFSDFMGKLKISVNKWITETVFCQEWEGAAHFSKCKTPLESMDCVDCESKMNATCAAVGALTSELGMMVLTAGVGNVASISAKVGAGTMRIVAQNAASKIKVLAPNVQHSIKVTDKLKKTKTGSAAVKVAQKGAGLAKLTAEQIGKLKNKTSQLIAAYEKSKVVGVITKVADVVTDPLSITTKASKLGVNLSNKVLKKVGTGKVAQRADVGMKLAQRAKRSATTQRVLKNQNKNAGKKATTKGAVANRLHKRYTGATTPKPSPTKVSGTKPSNGNSSATTRVQREATSSSSGRNQQNNTDSILTSNNNQNNRPQRNNDDSNFQVSHDTNHKKSGHDSSSHHKDGEEKKEKAGVRALGALTAADIAKKVLGNDPEDEFSESSEFSSRKGGAFDLGQDSPQKNSQNPSGSSDRTSLNKALNIGENASVQEMQEKAETLSNVYSEENRGDIVNRLQDANPGMSRSQANRAFENRRKQVEAAKERLAKMESSNESSQSYADTITQSKMTDLQSKKENLDKLISELQNEDPLAVQEAARVATANRQDQMVKPAQASSSSSARRVVSPSGQAVAARSGTSSFAGSSAGGLGASDYANYSNQGSELGIENAPRSEEPKEEVEASREIASVDPQAEEVPQLSLMDMLKLAERDDVDIYTDVKFPWSISKVEALSESAKNKLDEFSSLIDGQKVAKTKMLYKGKDSHLEVYEFSNGKKFSFLVDVNKNIELIPESRTGNIIEQFVKE